MGNGATLATGGNMGEIVVTGLGVVALGAAAYLLYRYRDAAASPTSSRPPAESASERLAEAVRTLAATLAAGFVGGLLVAGFGGRLFMRLVAATSSETVQGRLTEADEVIGEVTFGGSVFLIMFSSSFGILGGFAFYLLRRWLPARSIAGGLAVAGLGAGVLVRPTEFLDPESIDFEILGPVWFAALFALALIVMLGTVTATLIDSWTPRWPTPEVSPKGVAGLLPILMLGALGPGLVVLAPVVLVKAFVPKGRLVADGSTFATTIRLVLLGAAVVGWGWTFSAAVDIVRR